MPAPRVRAAKTQSTPAPVPVPWVGVTGVQLAPAPPHPSPDPAFQALAQSLVKLADLFPAEAPGLLAQGAALPPSSARSPAFSWTTVCYLQLSTAVTTDAHTVFDVSDLLA